MIPSLTPSNFIKSYGCHNVYRVALVALGGLAIALGGCSALHEDFPDCLLAQEEASKPIILRLSVDTGVEQSTTRGDKDPEDYQEPNPNDKFEKIESLRVLIIRGDFESQPNSEGIVEANRLVATTDNGIPLYDNLNFEVIPGEKKRIYLVANETYLTVPSDVADKTPSKFLDSYKVGKLADISLLSKWIVWLPGTSSITPEGTSITTGLFTPSDSRRLPLTEFFDIDIPEAHNFINDNKTFDAGLFLTRAAAKARFYISFGENFPTEDNQVVPSIITAITLNGVGTGEYVFPNKTDYSVLKNNEKTPIEKNSIWQWIKDTPLANSYPFISSFQVPEDAQPVKYSITSDLINNRLTKPKSYTPDQSPLPLHNRFIYFPESVLSPEKQFSVSVQLNNNVWLTAPLETNILNMSGADAIARDTYLPIVINFNDAMDIDVEVLPWQRNDYYVDYTANVGFEDNDKYLKFKNVESAGQTGDFYSLNEETAQLVLNYGKMALGSFKISSPLNCQWDAYLVTTGGVQDAIQFVPDPEKHPEITSTQISGIVGNTANFGIVATVEPGEVNNTAELIVIVTLADGTPVIANVIGNWKTDKKRLTVIENRK